jgi:hypothetical protein
MAKDVTSNPWYFDATTQGEGFGPNKDSVACVFPYVKPYIQRIKVEAGDGGSDVTIYSRKNAGTGDHSRITILELDSVTASDTIECPMGIRVDGVYIQALPTNGKVFVYHGEE